MKSYRVSYFESSYRVSYFENSYRVSFLQVKKFRFFQLSFFFKKNSQMTILFLFFLILRIHAGPNACISSTLNNISLTTLSSNTAINPSYCILSCSSEFTYAYMDSYSCSCASDIDKLHLLPLSQCANVCPDGSTLGCGSLISYAVYSVFY